jgi:hypothetical protein
MHPPPVGTITFLFTPLIIVFMVKKSTLQLYAFSCLMLFATVTANGQTCTGAAGTTCVSATEPFATAAFGATSGNFIFRGQHYQLPNGNTTGALNITSYVITVQNNIFSVGAQITGGNALLPGATTTIQVLNAATNVVICQALVTAQANGCVSATFSGLAGRNVRINFIFFKTRNGQLTFDDFGTDPAQAVLPVTFASFEGKRTSTGIQLIWGVAGETNVDHYEVERSNGGNGGFASIGSIAAKGSSSYTFTDEASHSGVVFYRVKNVDLDGQFSYSTMLQFKNGTGTIVFRAVPTIVTSKTNVEHDIAIGAEQLTIRMADGRVVRTLRPSAGSVKTEVDLSALQSGLYLLTWHDSKGNSETVKVIKQ